jgi:hypothetical protein
MKTNMGTVDRVLRVIAGVIFAALYLGGFVTGIAGIILLVISFVFVLTSLVGTCPLYTLFGVSTCPRKERN